MARLIKKAKSWVVTGVLGACLGLSFGSVSTPVLAQQPINGIEVLVNDQPISSFDINQRLRLVIAVSGGVKSQQEFLKVREQVIRSMVDERLQLQEAKKNDVKVDDAQLEDFFDRRAKGLNETPEKFAEALRQIGSSKKTMLDQMKAELAWSQLVQGKLGAFVSVSDEEVDAYIKRIHENRGKFEYHLAEIVLLVDKPEQEASVKENAKELVKRIRGGASFPNIAQQLSASSTAAVGGDIGWVTGDDITGAYDQAVKTVPVGQISDPIHTPGGYVIIAVRDRRRVLTVDPLDAQFMLKQLHLSEDKVKDAAEAAKFEAVVGKLHDTSTKCDAIADLAKQSGADGPQDIGTLRLRDLQGNVRSEIKDLQPGASTPLMKMDDGWRVITVCERHEPKVQEPDFDSIYNQIEQQRLSMMARRYLRDLRRDAIVDYR